MLSSLDDSVPGCKSPEQGAAGAPLDLVRTTPSSGGVRDPEGCGRGVPFYTPEGEPRHVGCGQRGCADCRDAWNRRALGKILDGIPREGYAERMRYIVLTAPGLESIAAPADAVEWNRRYGDRMELFIRETRRRALRDGLPRPEYFSTPELQERGVLHGNVLIRDFPGDEGDLQRWALGAGFGEIAYSGTARTRVGLARYIGGYVVKARDEFPLGTHYFRHSAGWSLAEARKRTPGEFVGGPPQGMSWRVWAERGDEYELFMAMRRYKRRSRVSDSIASFEGRCAAMFRQRARVRGWHKSTEVKS